ncbi:MAG: glycosyltransferase family 9 protein, partial [Elusimicrobiales bacterium]|nr:glycosyltransferase family 9 protein [Elusimicrobiales bacterium]
MWKIALHLVNASILSLRFYRRKSASLTGPLRVCLSLEGGLGDLVVGLNWVGGFYKKFSPLFPMELDIAFSNKQMLASFVPDFVHQMISFKEKDQHAYDLVINCVRCPVVEYADISRLPAVLLTYTEKLVDFESEHRDFLLLTPYKDTVTRNIVSSCIKRWHQPDILDEFNLTETFNYSVPVLAEAETLKKFGLYEKKYVTLNREGGSAQCWESTKLWPLAYYRELVEKLKEIYPDYELVEIGAGKGERLANTHRNLAGKTSLEEIKVILKHATLHIDGEGGLVHLRHALKGGPCCVFFGPTSPKVYGYEENINLYSSAC